MALSQLPMYRILAYCVTSVLLFTGASANADPAVTPVRHFSSGIAGTNAPRAADQAQTYFYKPPVRALLAKMEHSPLDKAEVVALLTGSGIAIDDLIRTRILRENEGRYSIGFSYFTLADEKEIHTAAARYVPSLVAAYRAEQKAFDRIFARYDVPGVDRKLLAYVLIAGFGLNWEGLAVTEEAGYRRPEYVTGSGYRYSFWAAEDDPDYSDHGFIWGSSTLFSVRTNFSDAPVDFTFSSYGDPYSEPRMNLPDVLYTPLPDLAPDICAAVEHVGARNESFIGIPLGVVLGVSRARSLGPVLFSLRRGPKTVDELTPLMEPSDRPHAADLIALLAAMNYVKRQENGAYALTVPVFDTQDAMMLNEFLALNRRILTRWLAETYPKLHQDLINITPVVQGVPFKTAFTQIWHDLFGLATRELTASQMIADPYAPDVPHKGSFGVVWRLSLYHWDPG